MALTDKQKMFCREYLIDLNATQAAIRAGYSEKTSNEQGARLLANVSIQIRISELKAQRNDRIDVDADYVLKRLFEIDQMDVPAPSEDMTFGDSVALNAELYGSLGKCNIDRAAIRKIELIR